LRARKARNRSGIVCNLSLAVRMVCRQRVDHMFVRMASAACWRMASHGKQIDTGRSIDAWFPTDCQAGVFLPTRQGGSIRASSVKTCSRVRASFCIHGECDCTFFADSGILAEKRHAVAAWM
jgi:hypothetical protein